MQTIARLQTAGRAIKRMLTVVLALHSATACAAHFTTIQDLIREPNGMVADGSVTVTWPAFRTAWNDQMPAGSFTTAINHDGQFSIDLVPNVGAQPSGTVYSARYLWKDGTSWHEYWMVPDESHVTLAEVRTQGLDPVSAQDGQPQAEQSQAQPRLGAAPQATEIEKYGLQGNKPLSPGGTNAHFVDLRNGRHVDLYHDPDRNPFSNQNDSWLQICNDTSHPEWTAGAKGWTGTKNSCIHQYNFNAAPGIDLGNPPVGPGGWSTHGGVTLNSVVNSPGISEVVIANQIKAGIGDNTGFYFYNFSYGGAIAKSDEGNHLTAALGGEQSTVYTGKIARGGTGATSVKVRCSADCQYPGDGRYLIDTQRPLASGSVTAKTMPDGPFTPGTFTIDTGVNPSSAWGTLAADVATAVATEIGTGFTNMTFNVVVSHGRFTAGSLVCFGGQYHEQAVISTVSGSGSVTLTVPLRHAHEAGSWIMQGGPCGTFIEFKANSYASGAQTIRYPVDILGATDSHTLVYRYFAYSSGTFRTGYWPGNVTFYKLPATELTNSNGTVSMNVRGGDRLQHPEFFNTASVYISDAANASFNGLCSNTKITAFGQLTCSQTSSSGAASAKADVSYGSSASGNTAFNLWPGAEVLDVLDHSTSPPAVNGTFTLEPNPAGWASGDSVENVHHYATAIDAEHLVLNVYNPMSVSNDARVLYLNGSGISGGNPAQPTFYASDRIINFEPASNYAYHGGTVNPPGGIYLGSGLYNYALGMQYAPDPPGSSAIYVGCPLSGCNDGAFFYDLFTLAGNGGSSTLTFTPATNVLSFSGKGLNLRNDPLIGTTLQSEMRGVPANLEFASLDGSGGSHTWTLSAPTVGGGIALTLPEASGTLALNKLFGGSGARHSAGLVPDPGPKAGNARFLREDGKWATTDGCQDPAIAPTVQPAVLRLNSDQGEVPHGSQPSFPVVVAHSSRNALNNPLADIVHYVPGSDGTFRLTVSLFVETRCDSGTLSLIASLSPIAAHSVSQTQNVDCTDAYSHATATVTAHGAAGVPINPTVEFNGVDAGSLRYMVDVILEQLQ
jgi:hypothetical protein